MQQETINTLKASAKTIGRELEALGYPPVKQTHLLQVLSKSVGFESWNALRAVATVKAAPAASPKDAPTRPYPAHYAAATYHANGREVEVVRWEDPVVGLGDHFYVYDTETWQCLTPTEDLVFDAYDDVPDYETIVTLLDRLQSSHRCLVCGFFADAYLEDALHNHDACPESGCDGVLVPFLKD